LTPGELRCGERSRTEDDAEVAQAATELSGVHQYREELRRDHVARLGRAQGVIGYERLRQVLQGLALVLGTEPESA
jgi:hypothetical protein